MEIHILAPTFLCLASEMLSKKLCALKQSVLGLENLKLAKDLNLM